MPIVKRREYPDRPDYKRVCKQTVTLYNVYDDPDNAKLKIYHKTIFEKSAFMEGKRTYPVDSTGITAHTDGLLIIPIDASDKKFVMPNEFKKLSDKSGFWTIQKNDKAVPNVGIDINNADDWSSLNNSNYQGCITIGGIDLHSTLNGELAHIQATPQK